MISYAFSKLYPDFHNHHVNISSAMKPHPIAIAFRSLQREIVMSDALWSNGEYHTNSYQCKGLSLARKLGMITYRSVNEWSKRFNGTVVNKEKNWLAE